MSRPASVGLLPTGFTNLMPVFGVVLGLSILDELMDRSMLMGGGFVVVGLVLSNIQRSIRT
ncbi:hypothetical protein [uncultured Roseobacter sp.]|uniref:hypothetical protein n=1 Tax=uncultured Roseobacter sp. TaxID=114847 RepID=UPI00260E24A3|nr:hypothetical protein [uncultured Roseobacter sp.]